MKRNLAVGLLCLAWSVVALDAHVIVTPRESAPGVQQTYTVRVPNELTVSSLSLELIVPPGLHVMEVVPGDGFTFDVRKENNMIVAITWKKEIKPKEFALFTFTAHNPPSGALQWKAHQKFADGSERNWVGEPGSKEPASVTKIAPKGSSAPAPADSHQHQ